MGRNAAAAIKRATLEPGGKDPAIILRDADEGAIVAGMVAAGYLNSSQICAAASRPFVEAPLYDRFVPALESAIRSLRPRAGMYPDALEYARIPSSISSACWRTWTTQDDRAERSCREPQCRSRLLRPRVVAQSERNNGPPSHTRM